LIYTHDLEGRFLSVNAALKKLFGYEENEIIGRKPVEFVDPEFRPLFEKEYLEALKRSGHVEGVAKYHGKQGQEIYIEYKSSLVKPDDGKPYISGIGRDVTDRIVAQNEKKRLESQLQQAQKMEAIATLTGGIAHDYNNLVTIIMGNLGLAIEDAPPGSDQAYTPSGLHWSSREIISQPLGCENLFGISILARKASLPLEGDHRRLDRQWVRGSSLRWAITT
jgi:PAS domain S-box-containing protein